MKRFLLGLSSFLVFIVLYFSFTEAPISPVAYSPSSAPPFQGVLAPNAELAKAEFIAKGQIHGPEDIAMDSSGRIYAGTSDGKIVRLLSAQNIETVAVTGGRPLGLQFDRLGNLIVADAVKGLLSIAYDGSIITLTTSAEGTPVKLADALAIATDGRIYFSDASSKDWGEEFVYEILEAKPYGRLLCYDPATQTTKVLLRDLYFANGVALSRNEDFVLVNETYRYRTTRYWLKGERAGTSDIFIDNLPGFPDGISAGGNGAFWLALFTVRKPIADRLHPYPFAKTLLARLPKFLRPKPTHYGLVLALDEQGRITRSLHDPTGRQLSEITSVREHEGYLYCGTLNEDYIGKYRLE
ncbi:SMP-30/gluconolactonase/LRE family protein [candidate division KSB1 bacterium]|nr:SMP-30/gluconolactonase/LRE family protein [candidate division KSB1 bacterium]